MLSPKSLLANGLSICYITSLYSNLSICDFYFWSSSISWKLQKLYRMKRSIIFAESSVFTPMMSCSKLSFWSLCRFGFWLVAKIFSIMEKILEFYTLYIWENILLILSTIQHKISNEPGENSTKERKRLYPMKPTMPEWNQNEPSLHNMMMNIYCDIPPLAPFEKTTMNGYWRCNKTTVVFKINTVISDFRNGDRIQIGE